MNAQPEFSADNFAFLNVVAGTTNDDDIILGSRDADLINGLAGSDIIDGLAGQDTIIGGKSSDSIAFSGDPFNGVDVSGAGRQAANLPDELLDFSIADDRFVLDPADLELKGQPIFVNGTANQLSKLAERGKTDANAVVIQGAFANAGVAASAIAESGVADGTGVFIYFNQNLQINRLVYSANLGNATADISILGNIRTLSGNDALNAQPAFSADNFAFLNVIADATESNDVLIGSNRADLIRGNAGDDSFKGRRGADELFGEVGNDTFILNSVDNGELLDGGVNNARRRGARSAQDIVVGDTLDLSGVRRDVFVDLDVNNQGALDPGEPSQNGVLRQHGTEVALNDIENIIGTRFNDTLFGNQENNVILGGAGNDRIHPFAGTDFVDGGAGRDTLLLNGSPEGTNINLKEGRARTSVGLNRFVNIENANGSAVGGDTIVGDHRRNVLDGLGGNDRLFGEGGNDTLIGGEGNDRLDGQNGNDILQGGRGNDRLFAGRGRDLLDGGDDDDQLFDGRGDDTLLGGKGNDRLQAQRGNNILRGEKGNDQLFAGRGRDLLDGGDGNDQLFDGRGDDTLLGGKGNDRLFGQKGSNILRGQGGDDQLFAGRGLDLLDGGDGNDILTGGRGDNTLLGGDGNDVLISGGRGQNVLEGGRGNDRLLAGRSRDTFVYRDINNGFDRIVDFDMHNDLLDLRDLFQQSLGVRGDFDSLVNDGTLVLRGRGSVTVGVNAGGDFTIIARLSGVAAADLNASNVLV